MTSLLISLYLTCGALLTAYSIGGLTLLLIRLVWCKEALPHQRPTHHPTVTVQLPVYNEPAVIERLLYAAAALDYPCERLTIQLLDDSTDATSQIAAYHIRRLRERGHTVQHIRRRNREGFKAGALHHGMMQSPTAYYAIFDADFLPPPDFLTRTVAYLEAHPSVGMVEGRWGHLNPSDNALTEAQAMAIDAHFVVEQSARSAAGLPLNFNGTGGVWRAECIHKAGGWRSDTLTEDLDLSYRAQLAGWQMKLLPDLVIPGELPRSLLAFKRQQFRWAKGTTQCLLQTIGPLWRSRILSLRQRLMGTLHLCQYIPYPLIVMIGLLSPALILTESLRDLPLAFLTVSSIVPVLIYTVSQMLQYRNWPRRMLALPALVVFGTGVAVSNTVAILAAVVGHQGDFQRTPKTGGRPGLTYDATAQDTAVILLESSMSLYVGWGAWLAMHSSRAVAPYLLISAIAYGVVAVQSAYERLSVRRTARKFANEPHA